MLQQETIPEFKYVPSATAFYPWDNFIRAGYGYGWDIECNCEDRADAKKQLKTYRENVDYPVRIKKWRERIGE